MNKTNWDAGRYDKQCHFVSDYGRALVEILNPQKGESILDLGCGTGMLANDISQSGAEVIGIDASPEMIDMAQAAYPQLTFQVADGQNFQFAQSFDAVFSNAALHWMSKPEKVIACVWECLKKQGRFVFEMGGKDNISQLLGAVQKVATAMGITTLPLENYFPSIAEYSALLESQGFRVLSMELYKRPTPLKGEDGLRNWIAVFRSSVINQIPADQLTPFFERVEQELRDSLYHESTWSADYVRLRGIAVKM